MKIRLFCSYRSRRPRFYLPVEYDLNRDGVWAYPFFVAPFALVCVLARAAFHVVWMDVLRLIKELKRSQREIKEDETGSRWWDVNERLPPMFENVLVFGVRAHDQRPGIWGARRWTGVTCGIDEKTGRPLSETCWDWLTPSDRLVLDVKYWKNNI